MLILDAEATRARLPLAALIDALRAMFVAGCEAPLRHTHAVGEAGTLLVMPAWRPGRWLGIKTVTIFPGNGTRGLPGLHSSYLLHDAATGVPVALLDGNEITTRRTVAASALAASYLARTDARRLVVVGAGRVARLVPEAMRCVRPIDDVVVWNRSAAAAEALAADWRRAGWSARATADLRTAVEAADIVSCATLAHEPLLRGAWLRDGAHLDLVGSFTPQMRESDAACFARARVFVDTPEALAKSGDVLGAAAEGAFDPATALQGTLAALCRGACAGRASDGEVTLFKSVGDALEDLAAAELIAQSLPLSPPRA